MNRVATLLRRSRDTEGYWVGNVTAQRLYGLLVSVRAVSWVGCLGAISPRMLSRGKARSLFDHRRRQQQSLQLLQSFGSSTEINPFQGVASVMAQEICGISLAIPLYWYFIRALYNMPSYSLVDGDGGSYNICLRSYNNNIEATSGRIVEDHPMVESSRLSTRSCSTRITAKTCFDDFSDPAIPRSKPFFGQMYLPTSRFRSVGSKLSGTTRGQPVAIVRARFSR